MRTLFDSSKNPLFRLMCRLVNEINSGAKLTRKEIRNRIFSMPEFIYFEAPETEKEENIIDTLFDFDENGFAKNHIRQSVTLPPNDVEIGFLKTMLEDDEVNFLLPDDLRKKLSERIENFIPLYGSKNWHKLRPKNTEEPEGKILSDKLSVLVEALRKRSEISCAEKKIIPCRLEYDFSSDKYFLLTWSEEKNIVEKIPVGKLEKILPTKKNIPADVEEKFQKFYSTNTAEISLSVRNTRNAVERCFALFGMYEKKARFQDDGTYLLNVEYFKPDEEEILEKIFSLGAAVTVLSPKNIRERIIKKFVAIKNLYQ